MEVEDAPFTAVELSVKGEGRDQVLAFRTNLDEWVEAGPAHPLRMVEHPPNGDPTPYIEVRDRLEALVLRPVYRSEEHTSELQSLMRISYAVFCLKTKTNQKQSTNRKYHTRKQRNNLNT